MQQGHSRFNPAPAILLAAALLQGCSSQIMDAADSSVSDELKRHRGHCGDRVCASGETCSSCPADCGACVIAVLDMTTAPVPDMTTAPVPDMTTAPVPDMSSPSSGASACSIANGTSYYVSMTGSDSNPGTSAAPFRTITYAYAHHGAPGINIVVMPGTYTDYQTGWGLHLGASGNSSNPIRLCSQTRGAAIIDGKNASDRNQAIYIDGSYNVVDGFVITGGPKGGISIWADGNQILRNEIHHNGNVDVASTDGQDGVYSNDGTKDNAYEQNYIHDNGRTPDSTYRKYDHGLYLCGTNELVINNISTHNAGMGLQIAGYTTVANMKVYNNVFSYNGSAGLVLWLALNGVDIKNNIIAGNQKYGVYACAATGGGVVIDHNLVFGNNVSNGGYANYALADQCGTGATYGYTLGTTVTADPLFVNGSSSDSLQSDFYLQKGSPAIDSGLTLSAAPIDLTGIARPQGTGYDIGAFEVH